MAPAKRWTFDTTKALVAWMADEYLSEIVLDALVPAPGEARDRVRFTWWLYGVGGPARVPYRVVARGVTRWALRGARDDRAIGVRAGRGAGVRIVMDVPGALTLHAAEVTITRGAAEALAAPARPLADYLAFHVRGPGAPPPEAILRGLGLPADAQLQTTGATKRSVLVDGQAWIEIYAFPAPADAYHWNVVRRGATDAVWRRAAALPVHLGATEVSSAWEFVGSPAAWVAVIAAAT